MSATFRFVEIFSQDRWQVCVRKLVANELEQCGGVFTCCIRHDNLTNKKQNSKLSKLSLRFSEKNKINTKSKHGYRRQNQEAKQDSIRLSSIRAFDLIITLSLNMLNQMSAIFMGYLFRLKLRGSYMVCQITDLFI